MTRETFWSGKAVLVTGGSGFLGRRVVAGLEERGAARIIAPRSRDCDLRLQVNVERLFADVRPDVVLHLAARVGGIGANRLHPGVFFYDNMAMGLELIERARRQGVEKFVTVGTICAYPAFASVPFREEALWEGYPEPTNAPYGIAKKALLVQTQAYREEFGFPGIYLLPVNLYGPGDNFDPKSSHVIPAMVRKYCEAVGSGRPTVTLWGDGSPTREFLYVDDAARGILLAAERYDASDPVNLGCGVEIRIRDLAALVAERTGFRGKTLWDRTKPNGQMRRSLDVSRARERFGFVAEVPFEDGLERTIAWYRKEVGCGARPAE